jgi:hypothetical protein
LEVRDRDTLRVEYTDPNDAADKSRATARIIQRVRGEIFAENRNGVTISTIDIDDSLFVRVKGETDQNDSPTAQDSISVRVFNPRTSDSETITLLELANGGVFNTGEFRNTRGLRIFKGGTVFGDGRLAVVGGEVITARYEDPDSPGEPPLDKTVMIPAPPDSSKTILTAESAFNIVIAPNPYRADRNQQLNLRAQVRSGSLAIRQVEIYHLAGERVRTIPGDQIRFGSGPSISAGQGARDANNWWNMQGDDGAPVASGTYFAKFFVQLTDDNNTRIEEVSALRKIVVIQ